MKVHIHFQEQLGDGSTCNVYKAQINNEKVAIKIYQNTTPERQRKIELSIIEQISHPNLIELKHSDSDLQWLATTQCMKVNLDGLLSLNSSFSIDLAKYIAYQLVEAVFYLRSKNIIHRDIKADNVMFKIDSFEPVLGDFGFAIQTDKQKSDQRHQGTQGYMAPELFENNDQISTNKLFSCDIFSLGILIFKLFFGHLPFNYPDVSNGKFDYQIQWDNFWKRQNKSLPKESTQLIQLMIAKRPKERIEIGQLLTYEWFQERLTQTQYVEQCQKLKFE